MGIQKRFQCFSIFLMVLLFAVPSYAAVGGFSILESMPGPNVVEFSVTTDYTDVIGFAVGNDYGFDYSATDNPPGHYWESHIAYNNDSTGNIWKIGILGDAGSGGGLFGLPPMNYYTFEEMGLGFNLNDVTDGSFDDYIRAFVFFMVDASPESINDTGFYGMAGGEDSFYAAFRDTTGDSLADTILTGEASTVPVPGAAILLFSGLAGLAGLRRKR